MERDLFTIQDLTRRQVLFFGERYLLLGKCTGVKPLNTKFGNPSRENYVAEYELGQIFMSYGTPIGVCVDGHYWFSFAHDFSRTTMEYCARWCGFGVKTRRQMLKSGAAGWLHV